MTATRAHFTADCRMAARVHPAPNVEARKTGPVDILVLHYTGLPNADEAIRVLAAANHRVSCHYLIDVDGTITQMVPEAMRAWHAGVSSWAGETDINSRSIGIEIQNTGHPPGGGLPPLFPDAQIAAVTALGLDIVKRWGIPPTRVLAHSDVAPGRKIDPGETFPWFRLAAAGLGIWVAPEPLDPLDGCMPGYLVENAQAHLSAFGYGIAVTGLHDEPTMTVLKAFQRRFRPARVDGVLDRSTLVTLERLCATYPCEPAPASVSDKL